MSLSLCQLPARVAHSRTRVHIVVETLKGSGIKVAFDHELGAFKLKGVLPEGRSFPYDFGFIPSTKAADGDPLDLLSLLDAPAFSGVVVDARLLGAVEIKQHDKDSPTQRKDRLVAWLPTRANTRTCATSVTCRLSCCTKSNIFSILTTKPRAAKSGCCAGWALSAPRSY